MKPETKPSLSARISYWLQRLREILGSFWVVVVSLFSKLTAPFNKSVNLITPKDNTGKKRNGPPREPSIIPKVVPAPPANDEPAKCRYPQTPWWKTTAELIGIAAVVAYTVFSGFQMYYAGQQATAAITASAAATQTLKTIQGQFQLDQRPYVLILGYAVADPKTGKPTSPKVGKPVIVIISFKNVGKSPALHFISHRHLLFGSNISQFRIEPPDDKTKAGSILDSTHEGHMVAFSVKDTFNAESILISPSDIINWDGSAIVVFGRFSYEDTFGNLYCTPYMASKLSTGEWVNMSELAEGRLHNVTELCPVGKY